MTKVFRLLAICTISLASASIAGAQTYKQIDFPGACPGTSFLAGGPNLEGTGVGGYEDSGCAVTHGFSVTAKGVYTSFDPPGSINTEPGYINLEGVIVGQYLDASSVSHGFILDHGKYTIVNVPGYPGSNVSSITDLGEISGSVCSDAACGITGNTNINHSFVRSTNGVFKFFDPPGATSDNTSTVSLLGAVVGSYTDTVGELNHGYLLFLGKYTTIDFPGATGGTFATGGNIENEVVGAWFDAAGIAHGYFLRDGKYTDFDYPVVGVQFTEPTGINALGVSVGFFEDAANLFHGFIRTP